MLTPQDIENKEFKISMRGYNESEVDDFLQDVCESFMVIFEENRRLRENNDNLIETVEHYKSMEGTLRDSVGIAGKSADEIEKTAKKHADEIVKNAELTADSIIAGAKQKIADEEYKFETIKREVEIYKTKIVELLNAQLSVLKGYPMTGGITHGTDRVDFPAFRSRPKNDDGNKEDLQEESKHENSSKRETAEKRKRFSVDEDTVKIKKADKV